jgi:hypothetical protein
MIPMPKGSSTRLIEYQGQSPLMIKKTLDSPDGKTRHTLLIVVLEQRSLTIKKQRSRHLILPSSFRISSC